MEQELRGEFYPPERSLVAATVTVAATYLYFLAFAQFGFLKAVEAATGGQDGLLRPIVAVMGLTGIAGSVLMAVIFRERRCRGQLMAGFVIAGAAAGLAWAARAPTWLYLGAALTGTGTGMVTVGLAGMLRREVGGGRLGLCIGLGTGVAYATCNLPAVFLRGVNTHAMLGVVAACTGLLAVQFFEQRGPRQHARGYDYSRGGKAVWTGVLLALVWLDSAAFQIIQHTPVLKSATWTDHTQLLVNAGAHLVAGVVAGLALDRRRVAGVTLVAAALLLVAGALIVAGWGTIGAPLYAAGVSVYSSVLVFYPARHGRVELAALVYAVAGWAGSALGIVAADGLAPGLRWLLLVALGAVPALLGWRAWRVRPAAPPARAGGNVQ
jgi:cytochrome c oxidase cbb3-type subunit 2